MKVKIGDRIYDVGNQSVMIVKTADDSEAEFIGEVADNATVSKALFPKSWGTAKKMVEWMDIDQQPSEALSL